MDSTVPVATDPTMAKATKFESFVFIDLESTGLPHNEPDGKKTRITEICMVSVSRSHLLKCDNVLPRIMHKIIIPVNPRKIISEDAARMTGLNNFLLEYEMPFDGKKAAVIKSFLDQCVPPLCFVAHNGHRFDFPLLKEELKEFGSIIPEGSGFSDSLLAFRELSRSDFYESSISFNPDVTDVDAAFNMIMDDIEKKFENGEGDAVKKSMDFMRQLNEITPKCRVIPSRIDRSTVKGRKLFSDENGESSVAKINKSFKLSSVYERFFDEPLVNSHCAEGDVLALIKCCVKYGEPILIWFENNYKNFADIKSLY